MQRRRLLAGSAALALAAPAFAPLAHGAPAPLRVGDQRGGLRSMLDASGVLADFPIPLQWSEFPAAAPLAEALNAGAIDIGNIGDAPFTFAAAAGVPIRGVLALRESRGGLALLVPAQSSARSIADLAGKRIATGRGSIGHQLVLALLEQAGMSSDAVQLSFLTPADARSAFQNGAIDAWSTWEPYTSQMELELGAKIIGDGSKVTPGVGYIAASQEIIASRRDDVGQFLVRVVRARVWAAQHIEEYAAVWSKLIGLPTAIPERWFKRAGFSVSPIDQQVIEDEQRTIDLFTRGGLLLDPVKATDIVDTSFTKVIEAARP